MSLGVLRRQRLLHNTSSTNRKPVISRKPLLHNNLSDSLRSRWPVKLVRALDFASLRASPGYAAQPVQGRVPQGQFSDGLCDCFSNIPSCKPSGLLSLVLTIMQACSLGASARIAGLSRKIVLDS